MFSITTMASSTTKPVAMVSAIRERLSRLYPKRYMTAHVPMSDTGTATPGISVARPLRRKTNTTTMTSDDGDHERALHVDDRGADRRGPVEYDGHVDAQRDGSLDRFQLRADTVHRGDDVRAGLAEDDDGDRALGVEITRRADVLHGIGDLGHVGHPDSRAVLVADDQRLHICRVGDLGIVDDVRRDIAVRDLTFGEVGVLQAQDGLHAAHAQAVAGELRRVDIHPHGLGSAPPPVVTWPTPLICESFCWMTVDASS